MTDCHSVTVAATCCVYQGRQTVMLPKSRHRRCRALLRPSGKQWMSLNSRLKVMMNDWCLCSSLLFILTGFLMSSYAHLLSVRAVWSRHLFTEVLELLPYNIYVIVCIYTDSISYVLCSHHSVQVGPAGAEEKGGGRSGEETDQLRGHRWQVCYLLISSHFLTFDLHVIWHFLIALLVAEICDNQWCVIC